MAVSRFVRTLSRMWVKPNFTWSVTDESGVASLNDDESKLGSFGTVPNTTWYGENPVESCTAELYDQTAYWRKSDHRRGSWVAIFATMSIIDWFTLSTCPELCGEYAELNTECIPKM